MHAEDGFKEVGSPLSSMAMWIQVVTGCKCCKRRAVSWCDNHFAWTDRTGSHKILYVLKQRWPPIVLENQAEALMNSWMSSQLGRMSSGQHLLLPRPTWQDCACPNGVCIHLQEEGLIGIWAMQNCSWGKASSASDIQILGFLPLLVKAEIGATRVKKCGINFQQYVCETLEALDGIEPQNASGDPLARPDQKSHNPETVDKYVCTGTSPVWHTSVFSHR